MNAIRDRYGGRREVAMVAAVALGLVSLGAFGSVWGVFTGTTASAGNQVAGASDWVAPTAATPVVQKAAGGTPGFIRAGGAYRIYVNATDAGNPASGIASVTGNAGAITSGQTAAALASGTFTVWGQSYGFGSSSLTAGAALAAGTYGFSLTSTDNAGNARTQTGYTVVVDNTAPTGSDVQTANVTAGTDGLAEPGDSITFTFSEPIDPGSIVSGWTGSAPVNAVLRLGDGGKSDDTLTVYNAANTTELPLGSVDLGRNDYANTNITFGATGTPSTIAVSGNSLVITLGTGSAPAHKAGGTGTMKWTTSPPAGATDRAGNPLTASLVTQSGGAQKAF